MRRHWIIHAIVVATLLVFMTGFLLQHTGMLAQAGEDARADHVHVVAHPGRIMLLRGGVAPLGAAVRHLGASLPSSPVAALMLPQLGRVLFAPAFSSATKLVTNDFAYFNPDNRHAVRSAEWIVTSGSLFARRGAGWTGHPDSATPNSHSTNGTGSATFRAVTRRRNLGNIAVTFDLLTQQYLTTPRTPAHSWDGVHVFLHYRSQHSLYVLTINRRDDKLLIKKKRPGGPANGGTYNTLGAAVHYQPPLGRWQHVLATIKSNPNHTVSISASLNGHLMLTDTDTGITGAVLSQPGAVGIRGDNTEFEFAHFRVSALG